MAQIIQNTPTLTGEDKRNFREHLRSSIVGTPSKEEIEKLKTETERIQKNYQKLVSISNGKFY